MAVTIIIVDDHELIRRGLRLLLDREDMKVVAEGADGHQAVRLAREHDPDIAVLDVVMPHMNGLDAAREIRRANPRTKIILLTMHTLEPQIIAAVRAGIRGYVIKSQAGTELVDAVRQVAGGGISFAPPVAHVLSTCLSDNGLSDDPLTHRERQVLQLVSEGRTTKEIGEVLFLSAKTAETYRARLMDKLNIHDTAGLVRYAIRQGLIQASVLWASIACDSLPLL